MTAQQPNLKSTAGGHIPELDGIRGIAIALVIGFHLVQAMPCISSALPRAVVVLSRLGQTGVDLFFVLSGFLITGILLRHRERPRALKNFWGRRFLRIFPLYYAVLLLVLLVPQLRTLPLAKSAPDWWLWTYLANVPPTHWNLETSLPHFWSLAVEEQFYLFWPLVVLWVSPRRLFPICIGLVIAAPVVRAIFLGQHWSTFYALPCRMDALAAGAALATWQHLGTVTAQQLRQVRLGMVAVCLLAVIWFVLATGKRADSSQIVKHTLCSVIYLWLIAESVLVQGSGRWNQLLRLNGLRALGKYSYGLYVIHPLWMSVINQWAGTTWRGPVPAGLAALCVVLGSGVTAVLSWRLIEQPCLQLKDYFAYVPQVEQVATVAEATALEQQSRT